ncbi:S41 family peptidase [Myxococcus sp. K15C18031901]|uniref:S41 family peptidase n=1 Tax=Myxococcus dinghuensis TaxID=2906761 RepID=UPI0020A7BCB9|nr:S41 family peptidase [Myxococcus dinghuensis]MCP3100918.1 S41 family peptidase [Myxococcus dinghuensis]
MKRSRGGWMFAWTGCVLIGAMAMSPCLAFATGASDAHARSDEASRNAAVLGRVWGLVKYTHPALALHEEDWDAALVEALPEALAATTPEALEHAVSGMLRRLDDPLTRIEDAPPAGAPSGAPRPLSRWVGEVLVLDLDRRYANLHALYPAMRALEPELARARHVILDLRARGTEEARWMEMSLGFLEQSLPSEPVSAPAERLRQYSGFPAQRGPSSGDFTTSFETRMPRMFTPAPGTPKRSVALLVNARTPLTPLLLALRTSPRTSLVAQGALDESTTVRVKRMRLPGGRDVVVRASERVFPPGSRGLRTDVTVGNDTAPGDAGPAFQAALRLLRTGPGKALPRERTEARVTPRSATVDVSSTTPYPSEPYRLLAVIRFWSVMRFFHCDPSALGDWDAVLPEALSQARAATDAREYARAVYMLAARVRDGHVFVAEANVPLRSLAEGNVPLVLRPIEGRFLVTELPAPEAARAAGISVGDEVVSVDGEPVATRAARFRALLGASHPAAQLERVASLLLAGADGAPVEVMFQGVDGRLKESRLPRSRDFLPFLREPPRDDAPWRMLEDGVGYADLRLLRAESVDALLEAMKDTRALVLDLRGYPQGSTWTLAPRLNTRGATTAARITRPLLSGGEGRELRFQDTLPTTERPLYGGRVVVLVDERTVSQGEYTAMMLRAASGATLVGSATAGAVGDTTNVCLPGDICVLFTGQRFEWPDGQPAQGTGLKPDIEVRPTVKGLRAGRDEVLERARALLRETTRPAGSLTSSKSR